MTYELIKYSDLGSADFGWLHAKHHFSFGHYYNPDKMGFGKIRVINDDIIEPHYGFDPHPHNNMEIITFVRSGAITHKDNLGNSGKTIAGDVQVMSAGTGILHSEYNMENDRTNIYQIWIYPDKKDVEPRWETASFRELEKNKINLLVSGFNNPLPSLKIHQDVALYGVEFDHEDSEVLHCSEKDLYILCSEGRIEVLGQYLNMGDAIKIQNERLVSIKSLSDISDVIIIET